MSKKKGKAKAKAKPKTPNAKVKAVETPPETTETYAPTITNVVKQDEAAALGVKDLPDISGKILVDIKAGVGNQPRPGEKRFYMVTKGLPLHHPRQNTTCRPGVPASLAWDDWVEGQVERRLLVEVDASSS